MTLIVLIGMIAYFAVIGWAVYVVWVDHESEKARQRYQRIMQASTETRERRGK